MRPQVASQKGPGDNQESRATPRIGTLLAASGRTAARAIWRWVRKRGDLFAFGLTLLMLWCLAALPRYPENSVNLIKMVPVAASLDAMAITLAAATLYPVLVCMYAHAKDRDRYARSVWHALKPLAFLLCAFLLAAAFRVAAVLLALFLPEPPFDAAAAALKAAWDLTLTGLVQYAASTLFFGLAASRFTFSSPAASTVAAVFFGLWALLPFGPAFLAAPLADALERPLRARRGPHDQPPDDRDQADDYYALPAGADLPDPDPGAAADESGRRSGEGAGD